MKEIKAIIQPHMLGKVIEALHALPRFPGVTISECHGQGRGRGKGGQYMPTEESIYFHERTKLEICCDDAACDELVALIRRTARTGNPGDGMITVADLTRVVRVRTGEEYQEAV